MANVGTINDYVSIELGRNQSAQQNSLVLITQKLVERMQAERPTQAVDYDTYEIAHANNEKAKLIKFKDKVADSAALLGKTKGAINAISARLTEVRNALLEITSGSTAEERAAAAAILDEKLVDINSEANGANQIIDYRNYNLIGNTHSPNFTTDSISTAYSQKGGVLFVEGQNLGSDYYVKDASGYLWRLDASAGEYVQYGADGYSKTGTTISTTGLTLDSFDPATGAVTFGGSGSLTGTVVRGGLGLLSSDFYNGLADDTSVAQAISDVDAAIAKVTSQGSFINAKATLLETNVDTASTALDEVEAHIDELVQQQIDENSAKSKAAQTKLGLAVQNLNILSNQSSGLIENMLSLASAPDAGPGVFGVLGY